MVFKQRQRVILPNLQSAPGEGPVETRLDTLEATVVTNAAAAAAASAAAAAAQATADGVGVIVAAETQVGTFLGAALFRKVLTIAAGPNNSTVNVAHGITGLALLVGVTGGIANGSVWRDLQTPEGTATQSMKIALTSTNLVLQSGVAGDYSDYAGYAILLYTKA